jgi:hypothetical protein
MSKAGPRAAKLFGSTLPAFRGIAEAERALYGERDGLIRKLTALSRRSTTFRPDFSPESLKDLEHWYFELLGGGGFQAIDIDPETFERTMAMYLGEVLVRNAPPFEWFVTEFAFEPGRYEIGVRRPLGHVMLSRLTPAPRERNRREQSIWRRYQTYSGQRDAR